MNTENFKLRHYLERDLLVVIDLARDEQTMKAVHAAFMG
jgi:hypothetical protein